MSTLSIFIDESGDFGEYAPHSPYYIISLVLHNQDDNIAYDLHIIEQNLINAGYPHHCVHVGPLIRGEEEYRSMNINERKVILRHMMAFFRHIDISFKSFYIEKKHADNALSSVLKLSKQISLFVKDNLGFFLGFDKVIIYYDNGQHQINMALASIFGSLLDNVEFRKVIPSDYRLFQLADLMCTLTLTRLKAENNNLSRSEMYFFEDERTLTKQYFKLMDEKEHRR